MEAEFGYRTENDNTRNVDSAQKADGRGTTAGAERDGHGAELERAARNAGQAVSAADAVERGSENAPDEAGSTERFDRDAGECRKIRETGWEPEREVFFRLQSTDREYEDCPDRDSERYEETAFGYSTVHGRRQMMFSTSAAKPAPFVAIARRSMAITRIPTQTVFAMIAAQPFR